MERSKLDLFKSAVCKTKNLIESSTNEFRYISQFANCLGGYLGMERGINLQNKIFQAKNRLLRAKRKISSIDDFDFLAIIGRGAFGLVYLVRRKEDNEIYALKQIKKDAVRSKNQRVCVFTERQLLSNTYPCASDSFSLSTSSESHRSSYLCFNPSQEIFVHTHYIVNLYETFQDSEHLYQLLEYHPGGDFIDYLIKYKTFTEDVTKFYIAQLVQAVDEVHKLGYVHRDIKPDNIVLDKRGSIKLLDFGLCKFYPCSRKEANGIKKSSFSNLNFFFPLNSLNDLSQRYDSSTTTESSRHLHREIMKSQVGTPHYMAPEVFCDEGYTNKADWWSVGIIMFECLYGELPFNDVHTHNPEIIIDRVKNWKHHLIIPHPSKEVSDEAVDLMKKLLCDERERISANKIRQHKWFSNISWDNLHLMTPPIKPDVDFVEKLKIKEIKGITLKERQDDSNDYIRKDLSWFGYTFKKEEREKKMKVYKIIDEGVEKSNALEINMQNRPYQTKVEHLYFDID